MDALRQVSILNNNGVALAISGDASNSMASFHSALSLMRRKAVELFQASELDGSPRNNSSGLQSVLTQSHSPVPDHRSYLELGPIYVYNFPFLVQPRIDRGPFDEMDFNLFSAAVLFNLALGFHIKGHDGQEQALHKAAELYQMCFQLLLEHIENLSDAIASFLGVVALNNKAHCHFELGDFKGMHICADNLVVLLAETVERGDENIVGIPNDVLDRLLLNSSILKESLPGAAPAG